MDCPASTATCSSPISESSTTTATAALPEKTSRSKHLTIAELTRPRKRRADSHDFERAAAELAVEADVPAAARRRSIPMLQRECCHDRAGPREARDGHG